VRKKPKLPFPAWKFYRITWFLSNCVGVISLTLMVYQPRAPGTMFFFFFFFWGTGNFTFPRSPPPALIPLVPSSFNNKSHQSQHPLLGHVHIRHIVPLLSVCLFQTPSWLTYDSYAPSSYIIPFVRLVSPSTWGFFFWYPYIFL